MATKHTFHVLAHRVDDGARWQLDVLALPGVQAMVRDLGEGASTVRSVIAEVTGRPQAEFDVAISLS